MAKVTIDIDESTLRVIKSPVFYVIAAFTGVSVTFAPLILFTIGDWSDWLNDQIKWGLVVFSFLIIYLVPSFYMKIASKVIKEVLKK